MANPILCMGGSLPAAFSEDSLYSWEVFHCQPHKPPRIGLSGYGRGHEITQLRPPYSVLATSLNTEHPPIH